MNPLKILNFFGVLLMLFSFSFLIPIFVGFVYEESSINIFISLMIGIFIVGCCSWVFTRKDGSDLSLSDGFIITVLFWLVLSLFGALPLYFLGFSFVDSLFESMSGITTTGATVFSGLDELDKSVLIYRQLLQWMGGMGLIVLAIAVMPLLGIGLSLIHISEPTRQAEMADAVVGL